MTYSRCFLSRCSSDESAAYPRFVLSLTHPDHRRRAGLVLDRTWLRIGGYLRAKVIVMAIVGALTYVSLIAIGVPFAIPLSVIVAFGELSPSSAAGSRASHSSRSQRSTARERSCSRSWPRSCQNLQGYVISPLIEGDQLDIHPLLVFVAVFLGASLGGAIGHSSPSPPQRSSTSSSRGRRPLAPCTTQGLRGGFPRRPTAHAP